MSTFKSPKGAREARQERLARKLEQCIDILMEEVKEEMQAAKQRRRERKKRKAATQIDSLEAIKQHELKLKAQHCGFIQCNSSMDDEVLPLVVGHVSKDGMHLYTKFYCDDTCAIQDEVELNAKGLSLYYY